MWPWIATYLNTYKYAEQVLNKHQAQIKGGHGENKKVWRLVRVFIVGNNPESDIRVTNDHESPYGME